MGREASSWDEGVLKETDTASWVQVLGPATPLPPEGLAQSGVFLNRHIISLPSNCLCLSEWISPALSLH